jgi:hypothetical protein
MAIKTTQWKPDTCKCIFEYIWEDTEKESTRVHTFSKAIKLCEFHKNLNANIAYSTVYNENTLKNRVQNIYDKSYADKSTSSYISSFDSNRKLVVATGLSSTAKASFEADVIAQEGINKITVL